MTSDSRNPTTEHAARIREAICNAYGPHDLAGYQDESRCRAIADAAIAALANQAPATERECIAQEIESNGMITRRDLEPYWEGWDDATNKAAGIVRTFVYSDEHLCTASDCPAAVTPEPPGFEGTRSALGALTIRKDPTND